MFLDKCAVAAVVFLFALKAHAVTVTTGLVTELNQNEVYEGLLFHDGFLFVGQSKTSDEDKHRVEIYSAGGDQLTTSITLEHSASFIYAYSPNEVLVVGRSSWPWKSHYTIISRSGKSFLQRMFTFLEQYQIHEFAGSNGRLYFNEPGSRSLFKLVGTSGLSSLSVEVSGPGQMEMDGGTLWVLERKSLNYGDENIVKVDTSRQTHKRFFPTDRNGLTNFLLVKGHDLLVASEHAVENVIFARKSSGKILHELSIPGGPRGLVQIGNCVAVMNEGAKKIHFIAISGEDAHEIDQWDISSAGDRLKQPRRLVFDSASGRIFIRSNYPCPSCSETQSSIFFAEQEGNETINKCLQRS